MKQPIPRVPAEIEAILVNGGNADNTTSEWPDPIPLLDEPVKPLRADILR